MASLKVACVVTLVCMALVGAPMVQGAITCGRVVGALSPCIPYLRMGGVPTAGCCNGVRSLNAAAATTADRRTACGCLKSAAQSIAGISPTYSQSLPGRCGVNLPYKFSISTDCST
ncbi:hypothetical protein AHAS_Ahas12G0196000 [Arachis hypogaea]|uniref:Non-specific lipid-transfer protein n=2 Tax=Arachis TaxID=3817 RepID=A0A445AL69_ARAHY|nr:hypothetical protein Ahy_B02g061483 [Arachis hypogaea]